MPMTQETPRATRRRAGGPAAYGWRWEAGQLVPVPAEQAVRWLMLHLRRQAWSLTQIADELDRLAIHTRDGQRWHKASIHRVVVTAYHLEATG